MTLSTTFRANRQRVTDASGVLVLLEISHPSFSQTLRLANDTQDWTSQGELYTGFPFELQLPNDNQGETPTTQLVIDNLGGDMLDELEAMPPGKTIICKIMIADRSTPDVHELVIPDPVVSVAADAATITVTTSLDYLMRQSAVFLRHDPSTSPGIFA